MVNWIKGLFSNAPDSPSLTKVLTALVVCVPLMLFVYLALAGKNIPSEVQMLVLIGMGGKVADKALVLRSQDAQEPSGEENK